VKPQRYPNSKNGLPKKEPWKSFQKRKLLLEKSTEIWRSQILR
jgi:hypothetical protein